MFVGAMSVVLVVGGTLSAVHQVPVAPPPALVPLQKAVAPPPNWWGGGYWGRVTEVTPDWIRIDGEGIKGMGPDFGLKGELRFPMAEHLRRPETRTAYNGGGASYRPEHVRVGDLVHIRLARIEGVIYCYTISIRRRPGGRVPPDPLEYLVYPVEIPYHERINAYNDELDRGPTPVAPPPRLVVPRPIPAAAP